MIELGNQIVQILLKKFKLKFSTKKVQISMPSKKIIKFN